jgi:hypothetical protein
VIAHALHQLRRTVVEAAGGQHFGAMAVRRESFGHRRWQARLKLHAAVQR